MCPGVVPARVGLVETDGEGRNRMLRALRLRGLEVAAETGHADQAAQMSIEHELTIVVVGLPLDTGTPVELVHALWEAAPSVQIVLRGRDQDAAAARLSEAFVDKALGTTALAEAVARLSAEERHADTFHLEGDLQDARRCRAILRGLYERWGVPMASGEVQVVLSELVTNAIRHGRPPISIRIAQSGATLRLIVSDDGRGVPFIASPEGRFDHGRGLVLVSALSRSWGVVSRKRGKDVWVELEEGTAGREGYSWMSG